MIGGGNPDLQKAIVGAVTNLVIKAATAQVPFLGFPIISTIFSYLVNKFANSFYAQAELFLVFKVIDFTENANQEAYSAAVVTLEAAQKTGDQNALDKAKADFSKTLADLISLKRPK